MGFKKALKNKRNYIYFAVLTFIGLLPFVIEAILSIPSLNAGNGELYIYVTAFITALYFLIGFIWADLYSANIRKKTKNWDGKLEENVIISAWNRRIPWWFAALVLLILLIILSIIYTVIGHYPFA
ncbi:MAG: hypothetical protein GX807_01120 [Erysipelotrichia bacterium]|jgi:hypothetical protein|nr:hypothetical protein [Bacilli bacterium]NLB49407.1 hypothetical protein [Erysipelotrichia bacterium]